MKDLTLTVANSMKVKNCKEENNKNNNNDTKKEQQ